MKTPPAPLAPVPDGLQPLGSFEAAARWNVLTFEWMTRGWQQWFELMTVWPAHETPAARGEAATSPVAAATGPGRNARAVAKSAARRAATRHPTRPQAAARPPRPRG